MKITQIDDNGVDKEGNKISYSLIEYEIKDFGEVVHPEVLESLTSTEGVLDLLNSGGIIRGIPPVEICSHLHRPNGIIKEQSIFMAPDVLYSFWKEFDRIDVRSMCDLSQQIQSGSHTAIAPDSEGDGCWHVFIFDFNYKGEVSDLRRISTCETKQAALQLAESIEALSKWED